METFDTLDALYSHLEEKADQYKYPTQIGDLFQKLRDMMHKANLSAEADTGSTRNRVLALRAHGG